MERLTSMKKFKFLYIRLFKKSRLFPYLTMIAKCIATTRMFALDFWTGCAALEKKSKINKRITILCLFRTIYAYWNVSFTPLLLAWLWLQRYNFVDKFVDNFKDNLGTIRAQFFWTISRQFQWKFQDKKRIKVSNRSAMFIPKFTLIQKCRLLFSYRGYDCKGTIRSGTPTRIWISG